MKLTFFIILATGILFGDTININGYPAISNEVILKINDNYMPLSGQASDLDLTKLPSYNLLPQFEAFFPLYKTAVTEQHHKFDLNLYFKFILNAKNISEKILNDLESLPEFEYAEPNYKVKAFLTPNDQYYDNQWDHYNYGQVLSGITDADIDTDEAWDTTTGSGDVIIAILDTGVNSNHSEFTGRMISGYDFINNDSNASDDQGHGTSCAGIAAARGNNSQGIAGICWECKIMPVKVLGSDGTGDDATIGEAVIWASDQGANVISMSLGGGAFTTYFDNAIDYATSNRTTVIAATGNDNFGSLSYPSRYENCVAVGAMSPCNERKNFSSCDGESFWGSNYGEGIDFVAPGVQIPATTMSGSYTMGFNGTSSACPHAAGVAGLIYSVAPDLTAEEVRLVMQVQADDIYLQGYDLETGYGRLNANKSVTNLLNTPELVISDPSLSFNTTTENPETQYLFIANAGEVELEFSIDQTGYSWKDSDETQLEFDWIDISNEDTEITFTDNDEGVGNIQIGFPFTFYGQIYSNVIVNPNGWIGFGQDNDAWDNENIPSASAPNPAILGFWDDLNPVNTNCNSSCSGTVSYYSSSNHFVVWFNDVAHWVSSDGSYTGSYVNFQIVLYPDGRISLNYLDVTGDQSPTIGMQNINGDDGIMIAVYNEATSVSDIFVNSDLSINFYAFPAWLDASQTEGILSGGETYEIAFTADPINLPGGTYTGFFWLSSNDYNQPQVDIAVTMNISDEICSGWEKGDLNQDTLINVLDIVQMVNLILEPEPDIDPCILWSADINEDEMVNVLDIVNEVGIILGG